MSLNIVETVSLSTLDVMAIHCWMSIVAEELRTHLERYLLKTVEICSEALPALFGEGDIILYGNEILS